MELHEAYKVLELEPLDEFMIRRYVINCENQMISAADHYRGIGATTWMLVSAMLRAHAGGEIFLGAPTMSCGVGLGRCLDTLAQHMYNQESTPLSASHSTIGIGSGRVHCGSEDEIHRYSRGRRPLIMYSDNRWKERAIRRIKGPYDMIREVRWEDGQYEAYAEDDEPLMSLTSDGVHQLLQVRPEVILIGFTWGGVSPTPVALPPMRGALTTTGAPVHKSLQWVQAEQLKSWKNRRR